MLFKMFFLIMHFGSRVRGEFFGFLVTIRIILVDFSLKDW